ncbi:MAG: winged helix-turn-helix transcriptional regulator [Chloroflexi bacterium]|nr:MAG: winged helix-turn-helix transcriptional regulator [Chloroflexota bacterium]
MIYFTYYRHSYDSTDGDRIPGGPGDQDRVPTLPRPPARPGRSRPGVGRARSHAALATVISDGPISQRKLSSRIRMDPATMVDVIDALEQSGRVVRRRNPNDRREYALVTTAAGRALFARARKALDAAERETLRDLDLKETEQLRELLGRIARRPGPLTTADVERSLLG